MADIVEALLKVQREIQNPKNTGENPFTKSKYAPLPDILNQARPLLNKQGIVLIQNTGSCPDGSLFVQTRLLFSNGSGTETIESDKLILTPEQKRMSEVQAVGSAITYGRRYQLLALLGIAGEGEDDDGEGRTPQGKGDDGKTAPDKPATGNSKTPKTSKTSKNSKTGKKQSKTSKTSKKSDEDESTEKPEDESEPETHDMSGVNLETLKGINKNLDKWIKTALDNDEPKTEKQVCAWCEGLLDDKKLTLEEFKAVRRALGHDVK